LFGYYFPTLQWFDFLAETFVPRSVLVPLSSIVSASDSDSISTASTSFR
jgi:hypothetical protein